MSKFTLQYNGMTAEEIEGLKQTIKKQAARIARLADMRQHLTPTVINGKADYVHFSEISKYINKVLGEE